MIRDDIRVERRGEAQIQLVMVSTYGDSMSKILSREQALHLAGQLIGAASPELGQLLQSLRLRSKTETRHHWVPGDQCACGDSNCFALQLAKKHGRI